MDGALFHVPRFLQLDHTFIALAVIALLTTTQGTAEPSQNIVETDPVVKLENGTVGFLQCRVSIQPTAVQWSKGPSFDESRPIIHYEPSFINDERGGPGYDDRTYNVTDDFTLVINEVTFDDHGFYFCEVADETAKVFCNESSVLVYVLPDEPFPILKNCFDDKDAYRKEQNCSIYESQLFHNITCSVWGYTPDIIVSIYFLRSSERLEPSHVSEWPHGDRTVGMSVTVTANASFEPYECRASYVTIKGELVEKSATITLRYRPEQPSEEHRRPKEISIILALFFFSCVIPVMIVYVLALRRVEEVMKKELWIQMIYELEEEIPRTERIAFKLFLYPLRSTFYYSCYYYYYYYGSYFIRDNDDLRSKPDLETATFFLFSAVSYLMTAIGALFKSDCPVEDRIPIYLIVMGSTSTLLCVIYLTLRYLWISRLRDKWISWHSSFWKSLVGMMVGTATFILCFVLIFSVVGSVWIYRNVWPNMSDPTSPDYCHRTLYMFSFWITTPQLILMITIVIIITISTTIREIAVTVEIWEEPDYGTQLFSEQDGVLQTDEIYSGIHYL